ncbi:MAG: flavodoxin, partial [Selenomonadaceae bacterium]|nr:flavodoxin [Selenomonadaceae bacterium]
RLIVLRQIMVVFIAMLGILGLIASSGTALAATHGKVLVAYFSRVDENYGVGYITKGNTRIIAEMIAEKTGADLFEIQKVGGYPAVYEECKSVASREKATNVRPQLTAQVENMADYDVVFLGYPIWYGDAPMPVYTFLESYDFSGKQIVPFCTHGGSGLSGTEQRLMLTCPNAKILPGFAISGETAQNHPEQAEPKVAEWLKRIGM